MLCPLRTSLANARADTEPLKAPICSILQRVPDYGRLNDFITTSGDLLQSVCLSFEGRTGGFFSSQERIHLYRNS